MMSNPPSSLQHRQAVHRRQNSTPVVAFEAMKVSTSMPQQRQPLHRRGQSFDQQRSLIRRQQQHGSTVSMTNLGSIHGQQILREAQQQKIARPGQQQLTIPMDLPISPECGIYSASSGSMPGTPFENMTMNAFMQQNHQGMDYSHSPQFFSEMGMPMHASMPNMALMDENTPRYFHATHIVHPPQSNGMSFDARRMSQPDLRVQTQLRPHTPSHQIQSAQFPLTPPFSHHTPAVQYSRSLQTSPAMQSPYPVPMTRGRSLQGIIENEEFKPAFLSTPTGTSFEVADLPTPASRRRVRSPLLPQHPEPTKVKVESRAADEELEFDQGSDSYAPKLDQNGVPILTSGRAPDGSSSPCRPALSPRRMSISDLNLEPGIQASIEETNITLDDIAQYIDGPDPVDNKWTCNFDGCNKKFGRKENIKSHVQTHLGDRQFRCDHCKKCFVRGHDLKRHAKIHTGTKPYPCLCGNSFARHDALTRHRQRGMCIGAFDGVVKKNIKRGRPRKHRPEMEDRLDKANRSRQKTSEAHDAYASSNSSYSNSSWGSPPTENMDNLSIRGTSPFEDMALFGMPQHHTMTMDQMMGFPPDTFSFTPPASPGYSTGNKPTPNYRELTPAELGDIPDLHPSEPSQMLPELPIMDPGLSVMSAVNGFSAHSLPSLSHSSSSPAADVVAFDFSDMPTDASSTMMSQSSQLQMKLDPGTNDFDTFLDYGSMDMGLDPSIQDFFTS